MRIAPSRWLALAVLAMPSNPAAAQSLVLVKDSATGLAPMYPSYVSLFDGQLYFRASLPPSGQDAELWRSDGLTAERVADIYPGSTGSSPASLEVLGDTLYFQASAPGGTKLWQYDPVNGAALAPGSTSKASTPDGLTAYNGNLYFRAARFSDTNIGIELWKFDGVNQTPTDLFAGAGSSYPQHFIEYNGLLYFNACSQMGQGTELHRTNGTAVANVATIYPGNGSSPEQFAVYDGKLYFSAYDGVHGRELWAYDSATNQARLAADIVAGGQYSSSNPNNLCVYDGKLYFSATDGVNGYELWSFDGTTASMVAEINPTPNPGNGDDFLMDSSPASLTVFDGVLYFSAIDGTHGRELWSFDGTAVSMVMDINPGQYGSEVSELIEYNGRLYFSADDGFDPGLRALQPHVFALTIPEPAIAALAPAFVLLLRRGRACRPGRARSTGFQPVTSQPGRLCYTCGRGVAHDVR